MKSKVLSFFSMVERNHWAFSAIKEDSANQGVPRILFPLLTPS